MQEVTDERTQKEDAKTPGTPSADQLAPAPQPESIPIPSPIPAPARSAGEAILDFIKQVMIGGLNIEEAVRKFLIENPEILRNLEIAVAGIVAGAIASDILSGGAAIAKDPAVASILAAMLKIGAELAP